MVIETSIGCTAFWITVDGVDVSHSEFTDELWNEFFDKLKNMEYLQDTAGRCGFVESIVEWYGETVYHSEEACESCGDYVTQMKLEI